MRTTLLFAFVLHMKICLYVHISNANSDTIFARAAQQRCCVDFFTWAITLSSFQTPDPCAHSVSCTLVAQCLSTTNFFFPSHPKLKFPLEISMGTHAHGMRSGGKCCCSFALSGCLDSDDSPSALLGEERGWGLGWGYIYGIRLHQHPPTMSSQKALGAFACNRDCHGRENKGASFSSVCRWFRCFPFFRLWLLSSVSADKDGSESVWLISSREESTWSSSVAFVYRAVTWISISSEAQRRTGLIYTSARPWWNWFDGNQRTLPCRRSR